jgi:hypothetical protein
LRRVECGPFSLDDSLAPEELQKLTEQGGGLPAVAMVDVLRERPSLEIAGPTLQRLLDGVAPRIGDMDGDEPGVDEMVKIVSENELIALAKYVPGGHGKNPGDFKLLKVFPPVKEVS